MVVQLALGVRKPTCICERLPVGNRALAWVLFFGVKMIGLLGLFAMLLLGAGIGGSSGDDALEAADVSEAPTEGNDLLQGDGANNTLNGLGGNDEIHGYQGNDLLRGGNGNDTVFGDAGDDSLAGNAGDDQIAGGSGEDLIYGGPGDDIALGGTGDDQIWGQDGIDEIYGQDGADTLRGGEGADILSGGDGDDVLSGEDGDDDLVGGAGSDIMFGNGGDDVLDGLVDATPLDLNNPKDGDAGDLMFGGDGDDILLLGNNDTGTGGSGADTFATGSHIVAGQMPTIEDYNQDEDSLVVLDLQVGSVDPVVEVDVDPANIANAIVTLNGVQVAYVVGGAGMDASLIDVRTR